MSEIKVENIGNNQVTISSHISAERFEEGVKHAYNKMRNQFNVPGFRKGKTPRKLIESQYGKEVFYEEAINFCLPEIYETAINENDLDVVSRPEVNVSEVTEDGLDVTLTVYVRPIVEMTNYKGVKVPKAETEVTEEDIKNELRKQQEKNARIEDVTRAVQDGDIVTLDFEGFVDGVAFEGGKGEDYDLTIGSHTFIDTFEEQLIGLNINDESEVVVTFPENYGQANLAGKPATFKVKINAVKAKELPELDDELAKDVSEFETLEELKADLSEKLKVAKENNARVAKENAVMEALIELANVEVPDAMIELQIDGSIRDFESQLRQQGIDLESYLEFMGQTMKAMREVYRPNAEKQVKGRLVLDGIVRAESFEISEEDVDAELNRIATMYQMEIEQLKQVMRAEDVAGIKGDIAIQKALNLVVEAAIEE